MKVAIHHPDFERLREQAFTAISSEETEAGGRRFACCKMPATGDHADRCLAPLLLRAVDMLGKLLIDVNRALAIVTRQDLWDDEEDIWDDDVERELFDDDDDDDYDDEE